MVDQRRTASASSSTCEDDERVVMISFPSSTRKPYTAAVETLRARNHRHCLEECERSPDCSSAVFSELLCEMSATRARHSVADIRPAVNQSYFEKACVDKAAVKGRSTHLSGVANYILAGFVEQVEDASGIEQCISACYGALKHYGFQCMSAMWYPMDQKQNCLLNSETKRTQEKMFIPEDTGHMMIYFEHPDALFMRRLHDETSFDEAKAPQLWTAWSSCHTSTERVRYQHCDDHVDIRKCPKEVARCGDMSSAQKASVADGWSTASANVHMSQ